MEWRLAEFFPGYIALLIARGKAAIYYYYYYYYYYYSVLS